MVLFAALGLLILVLSVGPETLIDIDHGSTNDVLLYQAEGMEDAKKAMDLGKEVLQGIKDFSEALTKGDTLETFGKLMQGAGSIFQGFGAVISLITMFLPKEKSEELKAIEKGFKEMHERFDAVERKLDQVTVDIYLAATTGTYKTSIHNRVNHFHKLLFVDGPIGIGPFIDKCLDPSDRNGYQLMTDFKTETRHALLPSLLNSVFDKVKYDLKQFDQWQGFLLLDAFVINAVIQACMGAVNETKKMIDHQTRELAKMTAELNSAIKSKRDKILSDFGGQLEKDSLDLLKALENLDNKQFSEMLRRFLKNKYYFVEWLVTAYPDTYWGWTDHASSDCANCVHILRTHKRSLFIAWCDLKKLFPSDLFAYTLCIGYGSCNKVITKNLQEAQPDICSGGTNAIAARNKLQEYLLYVVLDPTSTALFRKVRLNRALFVYRTPYTDEKEVWTYYSDVPCFIRISRFCHSLSLVIAL